MAEVFVPLNRFQSVVTNLTGEQDEIYITPLGVSSIVLSAQITNTSMVTQPVTILVTSNRELPVPNFESVYFNSSYNTGSKSLAFLSGSFASASALLTYNRQFLRKEVASYTSFQNNLSETPFTFISSYFENNVLDATDAIAYDVKNNTTIRTGKAAKAYYDKNGVSLIDSTEYSASLEALDYLNVLAQQVIKNQSVTGSSDVSRLYQSAVTQSIINEFTSSLADITGSGFIVNELIQIIKNTIETPALVAQEPIQLVTNVTIPEADSLSPVVSGKLVLEEGYGFIVSGSPELSVVLSLLESANE
jgi:cell fate (sporulation/competence/biofilm development) regulator YmcA (YheA/YmcA/DUF963 family)